MIKLRDYQQNGVNQVRKFFKKGKTAILQAPTGAGKTIMFSYITQNAAAKGKKVLILTNRTELLMQTDGSLSQFGIDAYLIRAGTKYINFDKNVYVAMAQTLRNRIKKDIWRNWILRNIDIVIIDECHLQDFSYIFESGILINKFVLGFTATPKRTGKMRQLALDYEKIIPTVSVQELIDQGSLVGDDYFGVGGADLNNIKYDSMKGDFNEKEMFSRFNNAKLYAGVVKNWLELAPNTQTLVFCVNIEHVIHTCEEFQKNGISARFLVSAMSIPKEPEKDATQGKWVAYQEKMRLYKLYKEKHALWSGERKSIIKQFKEKKFTVLVNAGILTTGFDAPEIETIVVNRATLSQTLWLQMIGRGSRIAPKKTHFNILDFGDNAKRLGHYTTPQLWALWHENKNSGDGVAPVKDCGCEGKKDKNGKSGCQRLIHASYTICPFCGYIYPKSKAKDIDLMGVMYDKQKHLSIAVKKISEMDDDELYDYFKIKGHKTPWLWRQLYFRGGVERIESFGNNKGWKTTTIETAKNFFR